MDTIKNILGTVAPFIGSVLGGPFGAMAGKLLGNALLGDEDASTDQIQQALINASPEQLANLKQVDADYKAKMAELGLDEKRIAMLDRKSARQREATLKDHMPAIMAVLVAIGFFGILIAMFFIPVQRNIQNVFVMTIGALCTSWVSIISYYYGSVHLSKHMAAQLKVLAGKKNYD